MRVKFGSLLALLVMLLSILPAYAEVELVDPFEDVPLLVNPDELDLISRLQDVPLTAPISAVSPDDQAVLITNYRYSDSGAAFLNIEDGSIVPLQELNLDGVDDFFPILSTELVWFDNDSAGQLVLDLFNGIYKLSANRWTGELTLTPTYMYFMPLSLAPNGSRAIIMEFAGIDDPGLFKATLQQRLPFSQEWPELNYVAPDIKRPLDMPFLAHTDQKFALNEEMVSLSMLDLTTGETTPLLDLPAESTLTDYAWSPNGNQFALISDSSEFNTFGGNRLIDAIMLDAIGEWAPADNPFLQANTVSFFDFAGQGYYPHGIRSAEGNGDIATGLSWSTDGSRFLVQMSHPAQIKGRRYPTYLFPDYTYLRFYDNQGALLNEFKAPEVNAPDLTVQAEFISPDEVAIAAPVGTTYKVFYYNQGSGEYRQISSWDGWYYQVMTTHQSRKLVYGFSSFLHTSEVYSMGWDGQGLNRLTWGNFEEEQLNDIRVDPVSFTLRNGAVRSGYLLQPAGAAFPPNKTPMVVWQEGGPRAPFMQRWAANVESPYNLLPNLGVPILFVPLSGRLGFGPEFLNAMADGKNFGQIDIDEMAEIVDQLVVKGWAAEGRVGVTGCSYGGYFSAQSITRHPLRYGAANPQCTLLSNSEEWHFGLGPLIGFLEGVKPTDDPAEYAADSPLSRASVVRTPTLLFHGEYDFLPVKYAVDFHDQIAIQGYPAHLYIFGYEEHGLAFQESQFRAAQEQILWMRRYLYGAGDPGLAFVKPPYPEEIGTTFVKPPYPEEVGTNFVKPPYPEDADFVKPPYPEAPGSFFVKPPYPEEEAWLYEAFKFVVKPF